MKNGNSPGCDDINGEYIIYAPAEIHKYIADTLNRTFETGEPIEELQLELGILTPLQKLGKKKGPPDNLRVRPIMCLAGAVDNVADSKSLNPKVPSSIPAGGKDFP